MDKIVAFSNTTDGRDKFTKALQYGSRYLAWLVSNRNKDLEARFKNLFAISRDSRKIFRLFKSLNEIKTINEKIKDLLWQENKIPILLEILSRLGFLFYWLFDNLAILSTIKFIHSDPKPINKLAFFSWSVGLVFGLIKNVMELLKLVKAQKTEKKDNEVLIFNKLLEITGKLGDLLVSLNGLEVPLMLTGKSLNDGVLGMGGFTSAVIAIYSSWK